MALPKPSEFAAILPKDGATLCQLIIGLMKLSVLFYRWVKWHRDNNGNITAEYEQELCAIQCATTE